MLLTDSMEKKNPVLLSLSIEVREVRLKFPVKKGLGMLHRKMVSSVGTFTRLAIADNELEEAAHIRNACATECRRTRIRHRPLW